jgi:glycosyltransferase involved in cell wall biosynthesis
MPCSILHVLYGLRAEGTPRLALELLREERRQTGQLSQVAVHTREFLDLAPDFANLGVEIHDMPWRRRRYDLLFTAALQTLRRVRPRGVIGYALGCHVPLGAAARALGIPFVAHVGTAPPLDQPRALRILRWQMLAGLPFTRLYVACSDYVRQAVAEHYTIPWRKTARVYNGIRFEPFTAARRKRQPEGANFTVGMVASLEPSKDHDTLLAAMRVLENRGVSARLRLIGDGTWRERLVSRVTEMGITDRVEFRGAVTNVPAELAALDVFAYSARPEEGMGIALVEALAAGLPCVGSNVRACREVLHQGELGLLVPQQDPELWADALVAARQHPAAPLAALTPFQIASTYRGYYQALFDPWPPLPARA